VLQAYEEFKRDGQIGGDKDEEVRPWSRVSSDVAPGERASRTAGMCVCTSTERERTVLGEVSLWNERGER
jgi:hypothetical protein